MKTEFSGNCLHTIDPKGRVTIPAAYREILSQGFTIGLNNQFQAIAIYPKEKWAEKCEHLARIPESDIRGTAYVRLIMGNSFPDCELDGQGRVLLPAALLLVRVLPDWSFGAFLIAELATCAVSLALYGKLRREKIDTIGTASGGL